MSEQKYYIGLKSVADDGVTDYLWEDLRFYPCFEKSPYALTLEELEKVTNEQLARYVGWDDATEIGLVGEIVDYYWVNPLIKLEAVG